MTRTAVLTPQAGREFVQAVQYIALRDPGAARRLRDAFEAAAGLIGTRPSIGRVEPSLARPRYRFWSLTAFSLLLVYDADTDPVQILRLVSTDRDLPRLLKHLR